MPLLIHHQNKHKLNLVCTLVCCCKYLKIFCYDGRRLSQCPVVAYCCFSLSCSFRIMLYFHLCMYLYYKTASFSINTKYKRSEQNSYPTGDSHLFGTCMPTPATRGTLPRGVDTNDLLTGLLGPY